MVTYRDHADVEELFSLFEPYSEDHFSFVNRSYVDPQVSVMKLQVSNVETYQAKTLYRAREGTFVKAM